jgi:hypothetical protein
VEKRPSNKRSVTIKSSARRIKTGLFALKLNKKAKNSYNNEKFGAIKLDGLSFF